MCSWCSLDRNYEAPSTQRLHHFITKTLCWRSIYNFYYKTIAWIQARTNTPFWQPFKPENLAVLIGTGCGRLSLTAEAILSGRKVDTSLPLAFSKHAASALPPSCCTDWQCWRETRVPKERGGCSTLSWEMQGARGHQALPGPLMSLKCVLLLCDMIISQYVFPQYVAPEAIDSDVKFSSLNNLLTCPF